MRLQYMRPAGPSTPAAVADAGRGGGFGAISPARPAIPHYHLEAGRRPASPRYRAGTMIGRVFLGRYEVQRLLGEGGMGRVYLARQADLARQVVVKVMHDHVAADPRFRDRFQRETLLMARFHHPNAVTLYDANLNDPAGPCIVMEYVRGVNLEALLAKTGPMSAARVGRIVGQLCEVLQAAHDEGVIHRDLKPANLMITDPDTPRERVKVMDFGLAKLIDDTAAEKVTDTNVDFAVGTPGYIAPEQVRGETMDHRGDLYSVGVMMYELLTGRLPFQGANGMDVLLAHATEPPPTFAEVGHAGRVPAAVEALVFRTLAKLPEDRPQSARELAERMAAALRRSEEATARVARPAAAAEAAASHATDPADGLIALETDESFRNRAAAADQTPLPAGADGLDFAVEAWMPEAIALRKLRGFVHDCGGEVLETGPGLVRVRLGQGGGAAAPALAWLGLGKRSAGPVEVELRLAPATPARSPSASTSAPRTRPS
jgi:tRNA A-37 threonylcarbamoyl transferase component Bud32